MTSPGSRFRPRLLGRAAAALLGLLPALLLAVAPAAAASPPSPSLVISEFYAGEQTASNANLQWFELYNPTPYNYPLRGLMVGNSKVKVPLNTDVVLKPGNFSSPPPGSFAIVAASATAISSTFGSLVTRANVNPIVEAPELFPLDTVADALLLYTPDGSIVIDQVNWGTPDQSWPNYNAQMWSPGLTPLKDTGGAPQSWGRTPAARDSNSAQKPDWTVHTTISPGSDVSTLVGPPPAFLGGITDWVSALGSILLWVAFVIVGVLAYRFERLRDTRTYWQLLLIAPSGLLFYTVVTIIGFNQKPPQLTDAQKWLAFPILALSAVLCVVGMNIFRNVARVLLEGK